MKRRDIHTDFAEMMHGDDFHIIVKQDSPEYTEKVSCKACGKEYHPGSYDSIDKHIRKHLLEDITIL